MAKINRVLIIPYKPKAIHHQIRQETGRLWTDCVKLHKYIRKRSYNNPNKWKWSNSIALQKHFKGKYNLHSQTIQGIIQKLFTNIETYFSNKKKGITTARLPRRYKKYFNPIFKKSAIKVENNRIRLSIGNKKYIYFSIPNIDGEIVLAELGFNKLYLTIQKDIEIPEPVSNNVAAIDFGIIHTAVIIDGQDSLAIVGRGIRSIKQGHSKILAKLYRKISKTKKGSRRNRKLRMVLYKLKEKKENRLRNALHQISRQITNWCVDKNISTIVFGDLKDINKNKKKKRRRRNNQEIGLMEFGRLFEYLKYKLAENGIKIKKISEAYTSQTCPVCGERHKVSGRTYKCECGYKGIRDLVGAYNIRNLFLNKSIKPQFSIPPNKLKYLRPIQLKTGGRSSQGMAPSQVA